MTMNTPILSALALSALLGVTASAGDLAPKAREILANSKASLITVSALTKMDLGGTGLPIRIGGLGEAQETSCDGLVLEASGLTVVSYTALNPMERVAGVLKMRMSEDDDSALKTKTELSRLQMRLEDGTEVPARLVLKDKELDLAFIVPDPKEGDKLPPFTPVKLSADPPVTEMDEVVLLWRHAKDLGYQPIVTTGHVTSVIKKPRTMYDLSTAGRPGAPIFLPDGRLLGMAVTFGDSSGGGLMAMGAMEALVLPASEITKLADQAKKAAARKTGKEAKRGKE